MKIKFYPVVPPPDGYERDVRKRRKAEKQAALHEKLMREVKEKEHVRTRD